MRLLRLLAMLRVSIKMGWSWTSDVATILDYRCRNQAAQQVSEGVQVWG